MQGIIRWKAVAVGDSRILCHPRVRRVMTRRVVCTGFYMWSRRRYLEVSDLLRGKTSRGLLLFRVEI